MPKFRKFLILIFGFILLTTTGTVYAAKSDYYDFGPYYNQQQVLGFSFSSLENLPVPKIPDNLELQKATGLTPGSFFYPFDRFAENIQLAFTFDPAKKEELRLDIAQERLVEAKTLQDAGKIEAAAQALGDYNQTLRDVSQKIVNADRVEEVISAQAVISQSLALTSSPVRAEEWNMAAKAIRNTLDEVAEIRGEPAIPEDLSADIQKLKEDGLISEEESNKLYSLKNRGEVREELDKLSTSGQFPPAELIKLDTAVAKHYPDVQKEMAANFQVAELRTYQTRSQPSEAVLAEMRKWQGNSSAVPPPNDIKPYLWYSRAQDLARQVDLTNFSPDQQQDVGELYPGAVSDNPTYVPLPSPSPSPFPSPSPASDGASPSPSPTGEPSVSPAPSATPVPADPYLQDPGSLPGQPAYIIKQFGEGLSLALTFDPAQKARFRFAQAERRLAEAAALSKDPNKSGLYESTLKTYQQTLTDTANRVKNLPEGRESRQVAAELEAQAGRHEIVFEKGLLPQPAKNPKLVSDIIKTAEDALDRSADVLDRPALPPALASRLDDLKAQGLILEEEAQNLVNSGSREETREKIRELVEQKGFPLADAKKMDEVQSMVSPADYNQLVEVRKVEELQNLRSVQTELAQTPTFKQQVSQLDQKASNLGSFFDPGLVKKEDLGGRENLVKAYEKLESAPRPINGGQFGAEATPGAQPVVTPPSPRDAVLTACPEGATFKQSEGCVWADSGKKINDYDQYKCDGSRQYYSFAAKKCVVYDPNKGYQEDSQPICPVGYTWSWPTQSCQTSTGGILPYPSPSAEPEPKDDKEREERSKKCPEGSSYQAPKGCVWDGSGKSLSDPEQYRCGRAQYYSFDKGGCVAAPKEGEAYPQDTSPACKESGTFWNWSAGKCLPVQEPQSQQGGSPVNIDDIKPSFVAPGNPLYFLKQAAEAVQQVAAFTPQAKEQVRLTQAEERLAEAVDALKKNDQQNAKKAIAAYTSTMQNLVGDLSKETLSQDAKNEIGKRLAEGAAKQNLLLQKLQALAPAEQDTPISAAVSASILGVDKAADIAGEPAIPDEVKSKIESLPEKMISEEDKKALLETDSRVDARLKLGGLIANGALTQTEAGFLNEDFDKVDPVAKLRVEELKKLEQIADASENKDKLVEKVEKNEEIAQKLAEFEKTFEIGNEVPAEIRPYVRLTRINEVAQTVRPDIVRLEDFQNRKDVLLAVATLQEEFKPTKESWAKVEDFRRRNPGAYLPPELARIEALSFSLGVRNQAGPCYLPTPPFAPNTPCPAPGAAIPITSYANYVADLADRDFPVYGGNPAIDKDGKPLAYGQGPKAEKAGICPDGYHWMYDSGGWCMSNSGNYSQSSYNYTPSGPQTAGYTPYSPYYNAPGTPPATYGYPSGGSYPGFNYSYSPPSYYGPASTYYTTTPPSGTVPGSGPKPTSPGQCPTGFHWMSDSGGWCMADGPTYVPPGGFPNYPTSGEYKCGSQGFNSATGRCNDGACPGGSNWDGSKCVAGGYPDRGSTPWCWSAFLTPEATTCGSGYSWDSSTCACKPSGGTPGPGGGVNCGSGYTWNGYSCQPSSGSGANCTYPSGGCPGTGAWYDYSSCSCKTSSYTSGGGYYSGSGSSCQPPSGGCGSNSYWDYGSCYCRSSGTYSGGYPGGPGAPFPGTSSSGGGAYGGGYDASGRYVGGSYGGYDSAGNYVGTGGGSSSGGSYSGSGGGTYCSPPSGGCGSGWWDSSSCSCKQASSQGCYNVSASSCTGSGWYFDSAACTCRQSSTSSGSSGGGTSGGGSTSSTGCSSGYHWMLDNGGWCMSDAARDGGGGGGGASPTPAPTAAPTAAPSAPPASSDPAPSAPPASSDPVSSPSP